jgi:Mce-associated membrane protein
MLSYTPDTASEKLKAARERLTGPFRDSYTSLTDDIVIPGAQQKRISATAKVTGAASVSVGGNHAMVMVFVDQTTVVGNDAPTDTDSVVQVTLDKIGNRWLISGFEPK